MKKHTKTLLIPCAAAVLTIGSSMMAFAATGWQEEDGTWRYYDKNGDEVTSSWKKSGNDWFWLDEDGRDGHQPAGGGQRQLLLRE